MHTVKNKKKKTKKIKGSRLALAATIYLPPRQHLNSRLSKSDAFKKEQCTNVVIARSKILGFHPEDSSYSQNSAFNKAISRHNQLIPYLKFFTLKEKTLNFTCAAAPLSYCCCKTQNTKQVTEQ
jgi:hypothetical protein